MRHSLSHPTAGFWCAPGDKIAGIKAQNSNPPRHSPQMHSQPDIVEPAVARFRRVPRGHRAKAPVGQPEALLQPFLNKYE